METLNDIVFRNRNKSYGAYVLRKEYKNVVIISVFLAILLIASAVAFPLMAGYRTKSSLPRDSREISVTLINPVKPDITPPPPVLPDLPKPDFRLLTPTIVENAGDDEMPTQGDLGNLKNEGLPPVTLNEPGTTNAPVPEPPISIKTEEPPMIFVQEIPTFPGGDTELYRYLSGNLKYPFEAKEMGIQGKVYIEFVVEKDGSVSHVKVKRGIGGGCDEEAVRVVSSMPKWNPGKQNGLPVRVLFNIPVKFVLND